jgi:membrane protease YdiL (CAAX protease family)
MGKDLITIATFNFPAEAEAFRLLLEEQGIQTFIADDNLAGTNWLYSNAVGGAKIQVAASDAGRAEKIVKKHERSMKKQLEILPDEDITFTCEDCGKTITFPAERRGGVETCPHCGNYVDVPLKNEGAMVADDASPVSDPETHAPAETKGIEKSLADSRSDLQLWFEFFAVLCLAFFPSLVTNIAEITGYYSPTRHFLYAWILYFLMDFQVIFPLLLIIKLTKDPWSQFGLVRPVWIVDIICGGAIWFCQREAYSLVCSLLPPWMLEKSLPLHTRPDNIFAFIFVFVSCIMTVFMEELVMRGYLISRLERLLKSSWIAVLISALLFGSLHLYQGAGQAIGTVVIGLVYAIAFCWLRRLWPLCIAHALTNLLYFM